MVQVDVEEDEVRDRYLVWAQTGDGRRFSSRVLSDGTLRLLALATLKNDPLQSGMLLFEEPENGVHPFRLKQIVPLLREMTTDFTTSGPEEGSLRQLLVNTHSPKLVSHLEAHEIIFAHMADTIIPGQGEALRITRMSPVRHQLVRTDDHYPLLEIIKYLDEKDLEAATSRLKGEPA